MREKKSFFTGSHASEESLSHPLSSQDTAPELNTPRRSFSPTLTRSEAREIARRETIMERFDDLFRYGFPQAEAARMVNISIPTLWRWRKNILPLTANCGRKSALQKFSPPPAILATVRRLQLTGKTNSDAWRAVAGDDQCPPALAKHLRSAKSVAPSLLAATRLVKRVAMIIEGPEFSLITK
jgi:hypothetical protein